MFVDASTTLDVVNNRTLFKKPNEKGVPGHILGILSYWNNKLVHV